MFQIDENRVCHILAVIVLQRSDKQVDRVEISPEQLSAASSQAEISLLWHVTGSSVVTLRNKTNAICIVLDLFCVFYCEYTYNYLHMHTTISH